VKLSDGILECPSSGECKLDLNKITKCFGEHSILSRWHDEYRLCNQRAHVKVTISTADAKELIQRLKLVEHRSPVFANAGTFMTVGRREKCIEADRIPGKILEVINSMYVQMQDLTYKERADFTKQLAKVIRSGVSIWEGLAENEDEKDSEESTLQDEQPVVK